MSRVLRIRREVHINGQVWTGVYRCGAFDEDGRWIPGGFLLDPAPDGSLPPANEAGADPVEVEAARLASADVAYVKIPRLGLREWSDGAMTGWEQHAFEPYTYLQFRDEPDMLAGWLARQIVEDAP